MTQLCSPELLDVAPLQPLSLLLAVSPLLAVSLSSLLLLLPSPSLLLGLG